MKRGYLFGVLLMLMSAVLFSAMSVLVRFTEGVSPALVTFTRFFTGLLVISIMSAMKIIKIKPTNIRWLLVRGITGGIAVYLLYVGIKSIGLGKGTMLNYTYPVFASLFAIPLVKEKMQWDTFISLIVALIGIYFLLNPKDFFHFKAIDLLVLSGGIAAGIAVNAIRKCSKTDSAYVIFTSFCVCSCLMFAYPAMVSVTSVKPFMWLILLAVGLFGTVAQLLMTHGYRYTPVTEGSLLAFLVPLLNVLVGVIFMQEKMSSTMIVGSILVLLSCVYSTIKKPEENL